MSEANTAPEVDAESDINIGDLIDAAAPAIERIVGGGATLNVVRPAGKAYKFQLHLETPDGLLRRLPPEMSSPALRQALELLSALLKHSA